MKRLQIIAVLGLLALAACSAGDEPGERPPPDAARDTKTTPRPDVQGADQLDASGGSYADEVSTTPDPDAAWPDTSLPPPDAPVPPLDSTVPPPDGAAPRDSSLPPPGDAPPPPPFDAGPDLAIPSCLVTFTVNGIRWDAPEGGADAQVTGRVVRLVGDAANIGSWTPTAGVLLTETAPGTWSGTATFRDQQLTEFKFVKLDGITPEWENWLPYDSNRSLHVECLDDGGVLRDVAAADGDASTLADGPADRMTGDGTPSNDVGSDATSNDGSGDGAAEGGSNDGGARDGNVQDSGVAGDGQLIPVPARGRTYVGTFGVRPPDATK